MGFSFNSSQLSCLRQSLTEPTAKPSMPLAGHWALGTHSLHACTRVTGAVLIWLLYMDAGDNLVPHFCAASTVPNESHSQALNLYILLPLLSTHCVYITAPKCAIQTKLVMTPWEFTCLCLLGLEIIVILHLLKFATFFSYNCFHTFSAKWSYYNFQKLVLT